MGILDEVVVSMCFIYQFVISPPEVKDIKFIINIYKCYKLMSLLKIHEKLINKIIENNFSKSDMTFR